MKKLTLLIGVASLGLQVLAPSVQAQEQPSFVLNQVPLFRLYNAKINDHFYTTDAEEATNVQNNGYVLEGNLGELDKDPSMGTKNVLRMWNPKLMKHFYTNDNTEAVAAQKQGYVLEGTIGYIQVDTPPATSGSSGDTSRPIPADQSYVLYRMYNASQMKHFYTTSYQEMNSLLSHGYRLEGDLGTLFQAQPICTDICPLSNTK